MHPFETIVRTAKLVVGEYRSAEFGRAMSEADWKATKTVCNQDMSNERLFNFPATSKRLWAMDVAAATWWEDIDILEIIIRTSRGIRRRDGSQDYPVLETLPQEIFEMIAQRLEPWSLANPRPSSRRIHHTIDLAFKQSFRMVKVHKTSVAAQKLQDFFRQDISKYTNTVIIEEVFLQLDEHNADTILSPLLESLNRKITVVFQGHDSVSTSIGHSFHLFNGYNSILEVRRIRTRALQNPTARGTSWAGFIKSLQLVESHPQSTMDCVLYAKDALLSFAAGTQENKVLSVMHRAYDLSEDDKMFLEELASMGVRVTKAH